MATSRFSNKQQITNIYVSDSTKSETYCYKPYKKILFFWTRKEGIYRCGIGGEFEFSEEELPNSYFLSKDNEIMIKPAVVIEYSNGRNDFKKHFDTLIEAATYADSLMEGSRVNYIKII